MARFLAILLVCFVATGALAEEQFRRLGIDDGLPKATIYSVQQDKAGYLWLGSTNSGLLRFDGYRFVEFPVLTSQELTQNRTPDVGVVFIDDNDIIWAGTWGLGLSRIDATSDELYRYTAANGLAGDQVQTLLKDNKNRIWVGTTSGLSVINTDNSIMAIGKPGQSQPLADQRIWSLAQAADGTIWIGTSDGLHQWSDDHGLSPVIKLEPGADSLSRSNEIRALLYADNQLWVGSRHGLFRYQPAEKRFVAQPLVSTGSQEPVINILSVGQDEKALLIGSYSGLYRLSFSSLDVQPVSALSHVNVRSIFNDRAGVLWLGSRESGLYHSVVSSPAFSDISSVSDVLAQTPSFSVTAILKQQDVLWLGSTDSLYRINMLDGSFARVNVGSRINAIAASASGGVYIGTDTGLHRYHANGVMANVTDPFDLADVSNRNVRDIAVDAAGILYLAMWGEGVIAWHPETNSIQHWLQELSAQQVGNAVQQVFIGADRQLWVATRYSGLFQLDLANGEIVQYSTAENSAISITNDNVQCVSEHDGLLALCSRDGLILYDRATGKQQLLGRQHGLPSDSVLGVLQHDGHLWVMTAKGLAFRPAGGQRFVFYNSRDGLVSSELNTNAVFADNKQIYFGAMKGLAIVRPELLRYDQYLPQPSLSAVVVDHQHLLVKPHSRPWSVIQLAPENHTMNFEFSALDYQDPQRNQFLYKLDGINSDWILAETRNSAFYANLPVGTYQLWLKASNRFGVFSEATHVATLQVLPYWWQQRWVGYSVVAGIAVLLWLMHQYRMRHVRQINRLLQAAVDSRAKAQLVLETKVAERTRALEDSSVTLSLRTRQLERSLEEQAKSNKELKRLDKLKDEFIATVSHELRTPLTAIRGAAGLIAQNVVTPDNPQYANMLQTIQTNSERLSHLISDILDLQKFTTGTFTLSFSNVNLVELAHQAIQAMQPYARRYQVELKLDDSLHEAWVHADAMRLRQVMDNLMSNAIKFSPEHAMVIIRINLVGSEVEFVVDDQGSGIPAEFQPRIFEKFSQADSSDSRSKEGTGLGLAICKKIIENHHGQIGFNTTSDQGTAFWFKLPQVNADIPTASLN